MGEVATFEAMHGEEVLCKTKPDNDCDDDDDDDDDDDNGTDDDHDEDRLHLDVILLLSKLFLVRGHRRLRVIIALEIKRELQKILPMRANDIVLQTTS